MSITTRRYTYQDLLDTPDDGKRYEIIDGELFVSASPRKPHVWLSSHWNRWLGNHVESHDLGDVFVAPVDVKFDEDNTVVPDIIFIRKDRLHIFRHANVSAPPDAIMEFLSPSTRHVDLGKKFELYARMGVPEYWIVDPAIPSLSIYVLMSNGRYQKVEPVNGRLRSSVLPDLEIDLDAIFMGMPNPDDE